MATLSVRPMPNGKGWQLQVSGRRVQTFSRKEGAMDVMEGRAKPGDTKQEFNRKNQLVNSVEHSGKSVSIREALFGR